MSMGQLNALFGSDKPNLGMVTVVKNKEIQKLIDEGTSQAGTTQKATAKGVEDWRSQWKSQYLPEIQRQMGQETALLDSLYGGGFEQKLSQLRQGEAAAQNRALEQTLGRLRSGQSLQRARLGIGGRNTQQDIMEARLMSDQATRVALQQAAQERADFGNLWQQQLGGMGQRQQMQERLSTMPLREGQIMAQAYATPLQLAEQVRQMDDANKFRSLYRKRDALERLSDAEAVGMEQLGQLTEMAGNVGGMVAGMCWIAREVYGDERWLLFRHWLLTQACDGFFSWYAMLGEKIARVIRGDEHVKSYIRNWMNTKIRNANRR
jgi:hypothetical protein